MCCKWEVMLIGFSACIDHEDNANMCEKLLLLLQNQCEIHKITQSTLNILPFLRLKVFSTEDLWYIFAKSQTNRLLHLLIILL